MKKRLLGIVACVVAIPLAIYVGAVAYFWLVPSAEDYAHRLEFDAAQWRDQAHDREDPMWPTRLRMVDDLIADKRLDGRTRAEVEALLGRGDETSKWREWDLVYHLGPERRGMFRIDSEWLVIRFDASGRVSTYRIVGD